jgi:hypothetical protein
MIKKLFFSLLFMVVANNASAISIGMIGDFNSWSGDVVMNDSGDGVNYNISNYTFLITGGVKFRQDAAWATNWGGSTFPTGGPGSGNIPVPAGSYDITINITTGVYSFTTHVNNFDAVGIYGGFNSWGTPTPLLTTDGTTYLLTDNYFSANDAKFSITPYGTTTSSDWSSASFPSGTATLGGATIPLTTGYYNVGFNNTTKGYYFISTPVSLIGDAVSDWSTDVDMTSTDGGINFSISGITLVSGSLKFRANNSWANNWGGIDFPAGTGVLNSSNNISVSIPGTYDVTFNRQTGAYVFTLIAASYPVIDFNGITLATTDGINYTKNDIYFASASNANFVDHNNASQFWGGTGFPNGTAVLASSSLIPIPAGYYNVSFNYSTGSYSFTVPMVSLIGDFTSWSSDVDMTSTDNGLTYSASAVVITGSGAKFRVNHNWGTAYGSTTFPSGTASTSEPTNIPVVASTYDVTFNRVTGDFLFLDTLTNSKFEFDNLSLYPNPTSGVFSINGNFEKAQVYAITGQLVKVITKTIDNNQFSVSDLNTGIYLVKVIDSENREKTIRLIKQ